VTWPPGAGVFSEHELAVLETYRVPRDARWKLESPALLVVDVVESFVGPDAPVPEAQQQCVTACGENAWRAIEQIVPTLEAFRAAGAPVAFSTIGALPAVPGRPVRPRTALRSDVVVDALRPVSGELQLSKVTPSAFFGTPLTSWLTSRRVGSVVIVGGATSGCVRATAIDAYSYGFGVFLGRDGCFDRVTTSHVATLTDIDMKYGRVVSCDEVVARLGVHA
jgi:maleamate amidohydrolase